MRIRMLIFLLCSFLAVSAMAAGEPRSKSNNRTQSDTKASAIYVACKHYFEHQFTTRERIARKATCNGFFFGIASTLIVLQNSGIALPLCPPKEMSTEDAIRSFIVWGENNQDKLNVFATKGVIDSLIASYPCDEKTIIPSEQKKPLSP
jgi:hypothetical protein